MNTKPQQFKRLKSTLVFDQLFEKGSSVKAFPLRLKYLRLNENDQLPTTVFTGFSVPKRLHKKATARNHLKRLMREVYRKYRTDFHTKESNYAFLFLYMSPEAMDYHQLERALLKLLKKFNDENT
ncbi:ribonuclease P protein component [Croceiramulus getboli]|nr:ribonuclease P protein component [Flavobacteriaceae bacterium YJPT1-3]